MKRLVLFIIFTFAIILTYILVINGERDYSLDYTVDKIKVNESYSKDKGYYNFILTVDDVEYNFVLEKKYSNDRKLVDKIDVINKDDYDCVRPKVKDYNMNYLCFDESYKDEYVVGYKKIEEPKLVKNVDNIEIYNKDYNYFVWNGYGFTDVLNKKNYNFLDKETYDNPISFIGDNYIIVADYDQSKTFDKFYIIDLDNKKVREFKSKYDIDFNSYFIGEVEDKLYLFDRNNSKQYKIDLNKNKISISNGKEFADYYNKEWSKKLLTEFKYYDVSMDDDHIYDYILKEDKLYLNVDNLDYNILVSSNSIDDVIYIRDEVVYYKVDDAIYRYQYGKGEVLLAKYFEWNFSYKNKIYIF